MTAPRFDQLEAEYAALIAAMTVAADKAAAVGAIARRLVAAKARYQAVERATGVPWFVVAVIHERECGQSFRTSLAQGDPWDRASVHVPAGRGPFDSWESAAVDALRLSGLDKVHGWSAERLCYELELYNGFGYRRRGVNSPYLWSFSSNYRKGKYVADGIWSANAVDRKCGCLPMLKGMTAIDPSIAFLAPAAAPAPRAGVPAVPPPPPPVRPPPAPAPPAPRPSWLRLAAASVSRTLFKRKA
jgi:lysozyme family protein